MTILRFKPWVLIYLLFYFFGFCTYDALSKESNTWADKSVYTFISPASGPLIVRTFQGNKLKEDHFSKPAITYTGGIGAGFMLRSNMRLESGLYFKNLYNEFYYAGTDYMFLGNALHIPVELDYEFPPGDRMHFKTFIGAGSYYTRGMEVRMIEPPDYLAGSLINNFGLSLKLGFFFSGPESNNFFETGFRRSFDIFSETISLDIFSLYMRWGFLL